MNSQILVATLLAASCLTSGCLTPAIAQRVQRHNQNMNRAPQTYSQSNGQASVGLPACIHGPAVGPPGDNVSRGSFYSNGNSNQPTQDSVGLPKCRTSAYMGEPGDGIRSDMGRRISGQTSQVSTINSTRAVGLPKCRTSAFMGEPGDGIRSDMGRRISGQAYQVQRRSTAQRTFQQPQPKAAGYADYTH